jgi:hypothetical protein
MATLKRVEKRLEKVEDWMKQFENETGPAQVMEKMNWLIGQLRAMATRGQQLEQQYASIGQQFDDNNKIVQEFMEENDLVMDWNRKLQQLKEAANAVQESETESMDVQEQAEDGEEMGEGNSEEKETSEKSKEEN